MTARFVSAQDRGLLDRVLDPVLGFDFFISYRHADAGPYAERLHEQLAKSGFRCFRDRREVVAGSNLWPTIATALRRSSALLAIVSPATLDPGNAVVDEIGHFRETLQKQLVVPVEVGLALRQHPRLELMIGNVLRVTEDQRQSEPTRRVVESIVGTARFVRRRAIQAAAATAVALIFGAAAVIALAQARSAEKARQVAALQRQVAERRLSEAVAVADGVQRVIGDRLRDVPGTAEVRQDLLARTRDLVSRLGAETDREVTRARRDASDRQGELGLTRKDASLAIEGFSAALADNETLLLASFGTKRERIYQGHLLARLAAAHEMAGRAAERDADLGKALLVLEAACRQGCGDADVEAQLSYIARRLASTLQSEGKLRQAAERYEQASAALDRHRALLPLAAEARVAAADLARRRAHLALVLGDSSGAAQLVQSGLAALAPLLGKPGAPSTTLENWAWLRNEAAAIALERGEIAAALQAREEFASTLEKIARGPGANASAKGGLVQATRRMAEALMAAGRYREAAERLQMARGEVRELGPDDSARVFPSIDIDGDEGELALARGDFAAAARFLFSAASALRERDGLKTNPWALAELDKHLADALVMGRKLDEAQAALEESLGLMQKLVSAQPDNTQYKADLAEAFEGLADVALARREAVKAGALFDRSLSVVDALSAADPADVIHATAAARVRRKHAQALFVQALPEAARRELVNAAASEKFARGVGDPQIKVELVSVFAALADAEHGTAASKGHREQARLLLDELPLEFRKENAAARRMTEHLRNPKAEAVIVPSSPAN